MSLLLPPRLLVFDLDGTLVDSERDLANSVNATLVHFGRPALDTRVIAGYIGDGAGTLVRRALAHSYALVGEPDPHDELFVGQALDWFLGYYRVHQLDFTRVYPGVLESLATIRQRHPRLPMAVLTNKPVDPSRTICRHLSLVPFFFTVYGGNSFGTKKPDPLGLRQLIVEASARSDRPIAPAETVMIGDSAVDVETARAAGTRSLGCSYGLSPGTLKAAGPDRSVQHASEWPSALEL